MIRCVAFDLDGVVIPSGPSFDLFETTYGITRAHWENFFAGSYQQAMLGQIDLFQILPDVLREWQWQGTLEEFADVWMKSCVDCDPEVTQMIRTVAGSGIRCCAATNQDNRRGAFLDAQTEIRTLFERRFYSYELGAKKPSARYFQLLLSEMGVAANEVLFVDDHRINVEGARTCGLVAEVCSGASGLRRALNQHLPFVSLD